MTEHKHAAVLRAIAEGREVEYFSATNAWVSPQDEYDNPISRYAMQWRIKPKPRTPRRIWHYETISGPLSKEGFLNKEDAGDRAVEFIEVLPDE